MMVRKPEDMAQAFAEAFNSGNIESVLEFYETNAVMAPERAKLAQGTAALRDALNTFLAVGGKMTMKSRYCIQTGDLARVWTGPLGRQQVTATKKNCTVPASRLFDGSPTVDGFT
jgi:ketosteroid isomerase-like protein